MNIGRFASPDLRCDDDGSLPILHPCVGLRFDRIDIRVTRADYVEDEVQNWIRYMFTRVASLRKTKINIEIVP